jgi:hypothetical protein
MVIYFFIWYEESVIQVDSCLHSNRRDFTRYSAVRAAVWRKVYVAGMGFSEDCTSNDKGCKKSDG